MKNIIFIDEDNNNMYGQLVEACKGYGLTKMYLAYNLTCLINCTYNDRVIIDLYNIYSDQKYTDDVAVFVNRLADWLEFTQDTAVCVDLDGVNLEHFRDFLSAVGV